MCNWFTWLYFFINVYIIMISLATVNLPYNYLVVLTVTKDSDCTSCAVAESCLTLCNTMDSSTPDFPVLHCLFKPMSIESVMPSNDHPLSPPFPPVLNLSQCQGLSQWVSTLHQVTKVLELQHQSFQRIFTIEFLQDWLVWFPCSPGDSQESLQHHNLKASILRCSGLLYGPALL